MHTPNPVPPEPAPAPRRIHPLRLWTRVVVRSLLISLLVAGVLAFSAETLDRALLRPHSGHCKSVRKLLDRRDTLEVLLLGQSDIHDAFVDEHVGRQFFNFAWAGESNIATYYKLKTYVHRLPRLRVIVLAFPLCAFSSSRSEHVRIEHYILHITPRDLWDLSRRKGLYVFREKAESYLSCFDQEMTWLFPLRLRKAMEEHCDLKAGRLTSSKRERIQAPARAWDPERNARKMAGMQFKDVNVFDPDLIHYFRRILTLADARGVKVVLLTCPVTRPYIREAAFFLTMPALKARLREEMPDIDRLMYRHLDYQDLYADRIEYFKNSNHLNADGATAFTRRVTADLTGVLAELDRAEPVPAAGLPRVTAAAGPGTVHNSWNRSPP